MINETIYSISELKRYAIEKLKKNWFTAILLFIIFSVIGMIFSSIPLVGVFLNFIVLGPLTLGINSCFLKLIRNEAFKIKDLFDGFSNFKSSVLLQLLISTFVFLWSLLLVIPGIIAQYKYSMSFYILKDNPDIGALNALDESKRMMQGYKGKLFLLHLSFIGWGVLSLLTLGLGFLWLIPYAKTATTSFYQNLKEVNYSTTVDQIPEVTV